MNRSLERSVIPGDELGLEREYLAGSGAYAVDGVIRASLVGNVVVDADTQGRSRINVACKLEKYEDLVINIGDKVLCRVSRTNNNQAFVDIVTVGDRVLPIIAKGVIRREDVSATEVDKVNIQEQFKSGDVIKASVISLGDSKHYYLSTAEVGLGVQLNLKNM